MPQPERATPVRPEELAALRDGLADLLAALAESRTVAGWLRHLTANPITSAETVHLLERCRDAFDTLSRVEPPKEEAVSEEPSWVTELEALATDGPQEVRERLSQEMTESAAIELHIEFWDRLRGEWLRDDPDRCAAFADQFTTALTEQFGLTPFYPANFQDHASRWVQLAAGNRMTTGRVREVLRPGLVDRDGGLRVPSRVSVE